MGKGTVQVTDASDQRRRPAGGASGRRRQPRSRRSSRLLGSSKWLAVVLVAVVVLGQSGAAVGPSDGDRTTDPGDAAGAPTTDTDGESVLELPREPTPAPTIAVVTFRRNGEVDRPEEASDALDNEARATIYEVVTGSPGISMSELAERTDIPLSTVRYHSRVLASEGVLDEAKIRGKRRLYPARMGGDRRELAAAMADDATASLLATTFDLEPASVSELADALDRSASTVSYHLGRLEEAGLLERERDGDTKVARLDPFVRSALAGDPPSADAMLD